jgi:hypothetical protein
MSKSKALEYNWLLHVLNGTAIANINTTGGTTSNWLALHTADPGQTVSTAAEGGYAAYVRVKRDRSTGGTGWEVTSNATTDPTPASPVSAVDFAENTATSTGTFTHFSLHPTSVSTGNDAFYFGTVTPNINFSQNVTPRLTTAGTITEQ